MIPKENLGKPTHFLKFGLRKGQALALVNVAASIWVDWGQEHVQGAARGAWRRRPKVIHATRLRHSSKDARSRPTRWTRRVASPSVTRSRSAICARRPITGAT